MSSSNIFIVSEASISLVASPREFTEEEISSTEVETFSGTQSSFCDYGGLQRLTFSLLVPGLDSEPKQKGKLVPMLIENLKVNPWLISVFDSSRHCF